MDASIRVNSCDKQIEVNDDGDYITLRLGDAAFTNTLTQLVKDAQHRAVELNKKNPDATPDEAAAFASENEKMCVQIADRIDGLFGEGTRKKVFGDRVPDFTSITEFFTQIAALVKEFETARAAESAKRIAKYTVKYGNS